MRAKAAEAKGKAKPLKKRKPCDDHRDDCGDDHSEIVRGEATVVHSFDWDIEHLLIFIEQIVKKPWGTPWSFKI